MILRAKQEGTLVIFELEGQIDFESTQQFRDVCRQVLAKQPAEKVILNLEKLRFVGSSGINQFIQVVRELNQGKIKPRLCNLSAEFLRLFRAYETQRHRFHIFENQSSAVDALFDAPAAPKKRRSRSA